MNKKKNALTAILLFANTLPHKLTEEVLSKFPISLIDTILDLWSFNLALY